MVFLGCRRVIGASSRRSFLALLAFCSTSIPRLALPVTCLKVQHLRFTATGSYAISVCAALFHSVNAASLLAWFQGMCLELPMQELGAGAAWSLQSCLCWQLEHRSPSIRRQAQGRQHVSCSSARRVLSKVSSYGRAVLQASHCCQLFQSKSLQMGVE